MVRPAVVLFALLLPALAGAAEDADAAARQALQRRLEAAAAAAKRGESPPPDAAEAATRAYYAEFRRRIDSAAAAWRARTKVSLHGNVTIIVDLAPDGSITHVEPHGSAKPGTVAAAVEIVKSVAPFAPFPEIIRGRYDTLRLVHMVKVGDGEPR